MAINLSRKIKEWQIRRQRKYVNKLIKARNKTVYYQQKYEEWIVIERKRLYDLIASL